MPSAVAMSSRTTCSTGTAQRMSSSTVHAATCARTAATYASCSQLAEVLQVRVTTRVRDELDQGERGRRVAARLREVGRQAGGDPGLQAERGDRRGERDRHRSAQLSFEHGAEERRLAGEAVVEGAVRQPGTGGDRAGGHRADAAVAQDGDRGVDELVAPFLDAAVLLLEGHAGTLAPHLASWPSVG